MMMQPAEYSGYRRLAIMDKTKPCFETNAELYDDYFAVVEEGKIYIPNKALLKIPDNTDYKSFTINGPALVNMEDYGER